MFLEFQPARGRVIKETVERVFLNRGEKSHLVPSSHQTPRFSKFLERNEEYKRGDRHLRDD